MYQFFVAEEAVAGQMVTITGSDVNHIRNVLRMRPGEMVRVSTDAGRNLFCRIAEVGERAVLAKVTEEAGQTELPARIWLFQGLPKSDKMELIVQKAVELGAYAVVPVAMKHCVAKLDAKKAAAKVARWQGIAESAAKQAKRSIIPEIGHPVDYMEALRMAGGMDVCLVPYEQERGMQATREAMEAVGPGADIAVFIGPEGGFADEEIEAARECGAKLISLGRRILRTETAGLATLSILMYHLEQADGSMLTIE